ncbi:MAG TPA: xanthine dehydrogenase family protein molybdopterin-binding subunit [Candidatus Lustribacter sp.]|jgi:CO/xanthine dehydrogenase Mo-binding subunit|nr:xanthine dehydrogenase family protein molybdopterin-binding subunit [Candidatus Lustribacter sp.]
MTQTIKPVTPALREVSRSVPRLEGVQKVTGAIEYIHHLRLPGMLYGKIVRSTVAHAKIVAIDAADARALPGVHAVITGDDVLKIVPSPYYGPAFHDQPVLAIGKVHHVGEPVAVVLATDPHVADAGADLVVVEYDELEPVFDEVAAAQPGAPIVHDELQPAGTFADLKHLKGKKHTNIALDAQVRHGDVARGFASADHIFEDTFKSGQVMHTPLEPMVSVAETRSGKELTIHTASQSPSFVRMEVARLLGWPENKVRVRAAFLGGGFGAKLYIKLEALVAVLALIVRRPVRIGLTMEEQFYTITKHGTTVRMKTGVKNDGTIVAREVQTWWNGGAFADIGPRVTQKSGFTAAGPYDIEHVALDSCAVYTNLPPAGAFRGFGIPQLVWAYESQADIIARKLGLDPVAFRLKNVLRDGDEHATGTIMTNANVAACVESVARQIGWDRPFDRGTGPVRRGRGIAVGIKASISPTTSVALVTVAADGSCTLAISTVDMGQGSDTAMAQVAAETLGIPTESIAVVHSDTDTTPYDMATLGSRSTYHMGHAVRLAADDARNQLLALAATYLGVPAASCACENGVISTGDGRSMSFRELFVARFGMQAGNVVGTGSFEPPYAKPDMTTGQSSNVTPFWMIGATAVEIAVDTETGRITVERCVTAGDVGRAINPAIVEAQLNSAAIMAIGSSISEVMIFDRGRIVNASLADYKIPGFLDIPIDIAAELIEDAHPNGPYGAKGVGESGSFAPTPAIANALEDATGVRVREMPLLPERVLRALRAASGTPLEAE